MMFWKKIKLWVVIHKPLSMVKNLADSLVNHQRSLVLFYLLVFISYFDIVPVNFPWEIHHQSQNNKYPQTPDE